jgi:hypothetical protein
VSRGGAPRGLTISPGPLDHCGLPRPPYVRSGEERRRWDFASCIVRATVEALRQPDDSGGAEFAFMWRAVRALYWSAIPTEPASESETVSEDCL